MRSKTKLICTFLFYSDILTSSPEILIELYLSKGSQEPLNLFFQLYLLLFTVLQSCPSFCHNIILDLHQGVLDENIKTAISSYIPNSGFSLGLKGTGY